VKVGSRFAMATMKGFGKWWIHDGGKETTKFLGL
jgi:hypothetical protein